MDLGAGDLGVRHGITVTSPTRTLLDLAATTSTQRLASLADAMVAARVVGLDQLAGRAAPGVIGSRRGGGRFVDAVAPLLEGPDCGGWATLRSAREEEVRRWLVEGGLPPAVRQHPVALAGRTVHLDLAYPELRVAVEFDGWRWHAGRGAFDRDRRRWVDLQLAAWLVVVVTSAQSREEVVTRVGRALAMQDARTGRAR